MAKFIGVYATRHEKKDFSSTSLSSNKKGYGIGKELIDAATVAPYSSLSTVGSSLAALSPTDVAIAADSHAYFDSPYIRFKRNLYRRLFG